MFETSRKALILALARSDKWNFSSVTPGLQFSQYQISRDFFAQDEMAPGICLYVLPPSGALSVTLKTLTPGERSAGMAMRTLPLPVGSLRSMSETGLGLLLTAANC